MTKYEVVLDLPDGRRFLVGYTARLTRSALLGLMRDHGPAILTRTGLGDAAADDVAVTDGRVGRWPWVKLGDHGTVRFSGRTQRDVGAAPGSSFEEV